jgi:hypothetical protein
MCISMKDDAYMCYWLEERRDVVKCHVVAVRKSPNERENEIGS